ANEIGGKDAGGDRVDADSVLRPLVRQATHQAQDAGFAGGVGEHLDQADVGVEAGDEDDVAALVLGAKGRLIFHDPGGGLGDKEAAGQVDVHDAAEFVDAHFQRGLALDHAGGVDDDI